MKKNIFKAGAISSAQLIRREAGMPSGPPAEFGESSLIASIIIESERVYRSEISHPHGLYAKGKCYRVFNYRSLFRLGEHTVKLVYQ